MFWGVVLEVGKQYTQVVQHSFHVSMATLEPGDADVAAGDTDGDIYVMIQHDGCDFALCTLRSEKRPQQALQLDFHHGENVTFYLRGNRSVHLTGYLLTTAEGTTQRKLLLSNKKRKQILSDKKSQKKAKIEEPLPDSESDEEPQSDDSIEESDLSSKVDNLSCRLDFDEDEPEKSSEKQKSPNSATAASPSPAASVKKKKKKKKQLSTALPSPGNNSGAAIKKVDQQKPIFEDTKVGHGPEAKNGKILHVYYTGRFESSGKIFDTNVGRRPLKFKLGKGKVIKGWDIGVAGMKVGGKRRLVVPPELGYGSERIGPIPPNSTLVFDIHLEAVS